jgi:uncharacterized membrane protein YfcA
MQICLATSLATIIVTSTRSVLAHNKKGAVEWPILRGWAPGIAVGALLGVLVAASLKTLMLQVIFAGLAFTVAVYMAASRPSWRLAEAMPTGALKWALSPIVGFLSVLMGIGGGSFGVPLMRLYGTPIHRAVGTASGFGVVIAVPSVIGFLLSGLGVTDKPPYTVGMVNIPAFLVVIGVTLWTTPWGVRLAHAMNPKPLKRAFAVFIMLTALNMLRKALAG